MDRPLTVREFCMEFGYSDATARRWYALEVKPAPGKNVICRPISFWADLCKKYASHKSPNDGRDDEKLAAMQTPKENIKFGRAVLYYEPSLGGWEDGSGKVFYSRESALHHAMKMHRALVI